MENKQTAVQWLIYTLQKPMLISESDFENIINQALELEKQQIIDAANIPKEQRWYEDKYNSCGEQYYSETYKKPKQ